MQFSGTVQIFSKAFGEAFNFFACFATASRLRAAPCLTCLSPKHARLGNIYGQPKDFLYSPRYALTDMHSYIAISGGAAAIGISEQLGHRVQPGSSKGGGDGESSP